MSRRPPGRHKNASGSKGRNPGAQKPGAQKPRARHEKGGAGNRVRADVGSQQGPVRAAQRSLAIDPAGSIPAVYVRARILHPLIYRKRLDRIDGARAGDLVAVYNAEDQLAGYGLFNPRSEIAVRMLWYRPELPSVDDWRSKLDRALRLRTETLRVRDSTDAFRVVHAEADELSGLVADVLGDVVSIEAFSLGMFQRGIDLAEQLCGLCGAKHYVIQASPQFLSQEGCEPPPIQSDDLPSQTTVQEYGTRFRVRFEGGHKTGFFCDQRENRKRLADFCAGKTVLDLCCYTGGFSVQAARLGQAAEVTGVDLDEHPLALAKENANLNQVRCKFVQADAFAYMREMMLQNRQYDVVILDPPKLIRTRLEIEEGTRKHFALNRLAMQLVKPGGLLLSCSCAGLLPDAEFTRLLVSAGRRANETNSADGPRRELKFLARTGAAADHPVIGSCLETEYLKAAWMIVE